VSSAVSRPNARPGNLLSLRNVLRPVASEITKRGSGQSSQEVCPWNSFASDTAEEAFLPRAGIDGASLIQLLSLSQEDLSRRFKGSAVKRTKRRGLLRNVAVALATGALPKRCRCWRGIFMGRHEDLHRVRIRRGNRVERLSEAYRAGGAPIHLIATASSVSPDDLYHLRLRDNEAAPDPARQFASVARHGVRAAALPLPEASAHGNHGASPRSPRGNLRATAPFRTSCVEFGLGGSERVGFSAPTGYRDRLPRKP